MDLLNNGGQCLILRPSGLQPVLLVENGRRPDDCSAGGGYGRSELNTIAAMVAEHRASLLEDWYEFFGR
jgi:hypothetical protein